MPKTTSKTRKPSISELKAELARLTAFIEAKTETPETKGKTQAQHGFGRVIGYPNEVNTAEYGTEYTYMEFVDNEGKPFGSPKDNPEAEALLKEIKAVRYGKSKRGKARFDSAVKAWSIQTAHVPSFVVMGTKDSKGKFTPNK